MQATFLTFNKGTIDKVIGTFKPYTRWGDMLMISSGVTSGGISATNLRDWGKYASANLPNLRRAMRVSGLSNLRACVNNVPRGIYHAIVYDYEPNFGNEPEFSWDFAATLKVFQQARYIVTTLGGYEFWAMPTGVPASSWAQDKYHWDYGRLAALCKQFHPQLQTHCMQDTMAQAADLVGKQIDARSPYVPWHPQVTIGSSLYNAVSPDKAAACSKRALYDNAEGCFVQWESGWEWGVTKWLSLLGRTRQ